MFRSTALRIAAAYAAAFAIATVLLGITVYFVSHRALERQMDDRIAAEVSSLVSEYRLEGEAEVREIIRQRETARATNDLGYALFRADGSRSAGALQTARPPLGWQTLVFRDPVEGRDPARAFAIDIAPDRRLVVAADWDNVDEVDHHILTLLGITLVLMAVIGAVGAIGLARHLRRRLAVIATGAEAIIAGDLSQRIPLGPNGDEFDRLGAVLNVMLDRIGALLENLQQVSSDIAHDLRQPLTRLRTQLEQGLESGVPVAAIEAAIGQTDQVLSLFGSILRLSEIEAGQLHRDFRAIDLGALARELGESYGLAIEDGGRVFEQAIAETPEIRGDRELLAQALINLLDNAQIHTPEGTRIALTIAATADRLIVTVADDGPGVSPADRGRLTRRFTRLEESRHRPGHGLGLSLVAAIARIHGASLGFADNAPGLSVTLAFPL